VTVESPSRLQSLVDELVTGIARIEAMVLAAESWPVRASQSHSDPPFARVGLTELSALATVTEDQVRSAQQLPGVDDPLREVLTHGLDTLARLKRRAVAVLEDLDRVDFAREAIRRESLRRFSATDDDGAAA
jgi:hypothetical protein